jgi:hypothetical protein
MAPFKEWLSEKFSTTFRIVLTLAFDGLVFLCWMWLSHWIDALAPNGLPRSDSDPSAHVFKQVADISTLILALIYILRDIVGAFIEMIRAFNK